MAEKKKNWWRLSKYEALAILIIVLVLTAMLEPVVAVRTIERWVCSRTGSRKSQITWIFGLKCEPRVTRSPLERWMRQEGVRAVHDWRPSCSSGVSLFGGGTFVRCPARVPPIVYFDDREQDRFIERAGEKEIRELIHVLKNNDFRTHLKALDRIEQRLSNSPRTHK